MIRFPAISSLILAHKQRKIHLLCSEKKSKKISLFLNLTQNINCLDMLKKILIAITPKN